ncbi:MAG TPA: M48 family peptidase [Sedimenticola sp.]|nr:M48 family peptidase [Sedimenticola sp.]
MAQPVDKGGRQRKAVVMRGKSGYSGTPRGNQRCLQPVIGVMYLKRIPRKRGIRLTGALLSILFSLLSPLGAGQEYNLPEMGDPSGSLLSPVEEKRLGQAFMRSVKRSMKVIATPMMTSYIQSLGDRLVQHSEAPGREFHFFLVDSPQINAFAGPGGFIGVNTGLVIITESESELASVVSHEIAHVTQNHLLRTFNSVRQLSLPATALAIAAVVLGAATNNAQAGLAAATGLQAGVAQAQINFTRANEIEADAVGIHTLAEAGFDPQAMADFFERMGKATRLYDNGKVPEFLRTHPVTPNRTAAARARAAQYPYRQRPDSLRYHLFRATLKALDFSSPKAAVKHFSRTLKERRYRNEEGERYGYVLALIADQNYREANRQLKMLLDKRPDQIEYIVAHALLLKHSGNAEEALDVTRKALELYPGDYPLSMFYAQALIDQQHPKEALRVLEELLRGRPQDELLFKLLAQAASDAGKPNLARQYLAEYYYLSGALEPAIQQLNIALRSPATSDYQVAQMTARLHELEEEKAALVKRRQ